MILRKNPLHQPAHEHHRQLPLPGLVHVHHVDHVAPPSSTAESPPPVPSPRASRTSPARSSPCRCSPQSPPPLLRISAAPPRSIALRSPSSRFGVSNGTASQPDFPASSAAPPTPPPPVSRAANSLIRCNPPAPRVALSPRPSAALDPGNPRPGRASRRAKSKRSPSAVAPTPDTGMRSSAFTAA